MLALHLLQSALVHVNTLLMQQVLADPKWADTLTDVDRRALSPLFWTHVNPYGRFELDMNRHLDLDLTVRDTVPGRAPRRADRRRPWGEELGLRSPTNSFWSPNPRRITTRTGVHFTGQGSTRTSWFRASPRPWQIPQVIRPALVSQMCSHVADASWSFSRDSCEAW
ncbi:Tn3 family transposase [Streptomyces lydicus]|uniref:Tn3 family transposase n=1 Tax=Streptomyces lydicus TaxID=47763 RepID=UPI003403F249